MNFYCLTWKVEEICAIFIENLLDIYLVIWILVDEALLAILQ